MTPRWPVVIFDVDGTLVNSVDLIVESYQQAFRTVLGQERDATEVRTWIGQTLRGTFQRVHPERAEELQKCYSAWNHAHAETDIRPYPGMPELVAELAAAGIRLGAATSKRGDPARSTLALGGVADLVPLYAALEDTERHKPDPDPLLLAAERAGGRPPETVYVGDAVVDIQAARAAGLDSVAVTWGAGTREALLAAGPTAICDTIDELRLILLPPAAER